MPERYSEEGVGVVEQFVDEEGVETGGIFGNAPATVSNASLAEQTTSSLMSGPGPGFPHVRGSGHASGEVVAPAARQFFANPYAMGVTDGELHAHTLGMSVIAVVAGAVVGVKYGGLYGGIAGSLLGGAAVNAFRAVSRLRDGTDESDKEAKISGTYAVVAGTAAAVIWTKLVNRPYTTNRGARRTRSTTDFSENHTSCGIRPVGP